MQVQTIPVSSPIACHLPVCLHACDSTPEAGRVAGVDHAGDVDVVVVDRATSSGAVTGLRAT